MKIFDLKFSDGKGCRCIVLEESANDDEDKRQLTAKFRDGYVIDIRKVIAPPPVKLPWVRATNDTWTLGLFILTRIGEGLLNCRWPGGDITGDKEEISAVVRLNWESGMLT
jgi:hypothetical protein